MCSLNQIGESTGLWHKLEIIQIFDNICCRTSQSTGIMGTGSEWNYLLHVKFSTDCWANKYGRYVELQANEGRAKTAQIHIHKIPSYTATHTHLQSHAHTHSVGCPQSAMDPIQTTTTASIRVCVWVFVCEWLCVCNYIHKLCVHTCVCVCVGHCALADQTILSLWLLFFCHKYLLDIWARAKLMERGVCRVGRETELPSKFKCSSLEIQYNSVRRSSYAINTYQIDAMQIPNCSFIMKWWSSHKRKYFNTSIIQGQTHPNRH